MRKSFLDHVLLGAKSITPEEGRGEPARGSSWWKHTSAKIAITKHGLLLKGL